MLLIGNRAADLDGKAVALLGQIADIAKPHGVTIAIYPHYQDYTQTLAEALRLVKKLNRPEEVGVMFTFTHWQNYDPNRDLRAVLADAAPFLKSVSINGSNKTKPAVLPLSEGDYDNAELLDILRGIHFKGSVGLMCWGLGGDARVHLTASMQKWKNLVSGNRIEIKDQLAEFETKDLKGRIGDGRFIGVNQLVHKPSGTKISGDGVANRHGLLSLYRVFTRNQRYGESAYDWPEREITASGHAVEMRWSATAERPFELQARYTFPKPNEVKLQVSVTARAELVDFEVQTASYFDTTFPLAEVQIEAEKFATSPAQLGMWHAFPRDERAVATINDGRWRRGSSPVSFTVRKPFSTPLSVRRHAGGKLAATLRSSAEDCFAIYTAHDGEAHFSNYHALFGRTIPAGATATASVTLRIE